MLSTYHCTQRYPFWRGSFSNTDNKAYSAVTISTASDVKYIFKYLAANYICDCKKMIGISSWHYSTLQTAANNILGWYDGISQLFKTDVMTIQYGYIW